jgi:hypothetical protein
MLLVGGPGNGKTDALEHLVECLDEQLGCKGQLRQALASQLRPDGFYPRKAQISLSGLSTGQKRPTISSLSIVQDASVNDISAPSLPEAELLLEDLASQLKPGRDNLYVACINRGIVAEAYSLALKNEPASPATEFLATLITALSPAPKPLALWPMVDYPHVAIWPMDVESLVLPRGVPSPAEQVLRTALDEAKWSNCPTCSANRLCPFLRNVQVLREDQESFQALLEFLRYLELYTSTPLNFRDLFSLVTHILVGHDSDFPSGDPCEWVKRNHGDLESGSRKMEALMDLLGKHYEHAMFPRWPQFTDPAPVSSTVLVADNSDLSAGALFSYLSKRTNTPRTVAEKILHSTAGQSLEPFEAGSGAFIGHTGLTIGQVEEAFSHSIRQGLNLVSGHIPELHRLLLENLAASYERVAARKISQKEVPQLETFSRLLKMFCCRVSLRSICTRKGTFRNQQHYRSYVSAIEDARSMKELAQQLRKFYLATDDKLVVSLLTTFGQPPPELAADVTLFADRVRFNGTPALSPTDPTDVPLPTAPFLYADNFPIPLTFKLFRALTLVHDGLKPASLPTELCALLGYLKAQIGGKTTHGSTDNMSFIKVGPLRSRVRFGLEGEFVLEPA